jgi:cation:H+ antiporter
LITLFLEISFFIAGLFLLIGGADLLVRGASKLAVQIGMSPLVIGLTVVAFGTSAPELAIGLQSGSAGEMDLLLGNVIGSNIFNVLFVLGISAIITPLLVSRKLVKLDVPFMVGISIVLYFFCVNGVISRIEGGVLFLVLCVYIGYLIYDSRSENSEKQIQLNIEYAKSAEWHWFWYLLLIGVGLALLVLGARWLVESAVKFAEYLGLSSLIIGLTIVAVGTSLPEVATSIVASLKGERDMAVGNIVGSNLFNMMCIIGLTAVILPEDIPVSAGILGFDLPVMIAVMVACLPIFFTGHLIARWEGILFFVYYIIYTSYLILAAGQHDLLPLLNSAMVWFVLPLTIITFIIIVVREVKSKP